MPKWDSENTTVLTNETPPAESTTTSSTGHTIPIVIKATEEGKRIYKLGICTGEKDTPENIAKIMQDVQVFRDYYEMMKDSPFDVIEFDINKDVDWNVGRKNEKGKYENKHGNWYGWHNRKTDSGCARKRKEK